jgi:hypothetical protein
MFMVRWCEHCVKDADPSDPCSVVGCAFLFEVGDPDYPKEWQYGPDGQPECTAFIDRDVPPRPADLPGQGFLFGEPPP